MIGLIGPLVFERARGQDGDVHARWLVVIAIAACGVRTPPPIDVAALVRTRGPVEARRDLAIRTLDRPRDVQAHLALAELDDMLRRPSDAIDELEIVVSLGGPAGIRWHEADRARLARLVLARGRARAERNSATALADLVRARQLGAQLPDREIAIARVLAATSELRHVDAHVRAAGRARLAALVDTPNAISAWRGARDHASPEDHGAFGDWLWSQGAYREAYEQLDAWHRATRPPRNEPLQTGFLRALAWWSPLWLGEVRPPSADELVGPERCRFPNAPHCLAHEVLGDEQAELALAASPIGAPTRDPDDAAAWTAIALHEQNAGHAAWGATLVARVDLSALAGDPPQLFPTVPGWARSVFARLVGRRAPLPSDAELAAAPPSAHQVVAMLRALDKGETTDQVTITGAPHPAAAVRYALTRGAGSNAEPALTTLVGARDPVVADRRGDDFIAAAVDAAAAHATLGALWEALGDPSRARREWQAAVARSPEPRFVRGLAIAQARGGDGAAAMITATTAAAAWGDPAIVWIDVARALAASGTWVHAMTAARSAIDLAGPAALPQALDIAIEASNGLGRTAQARAFAMQRARLPPAIATAHASDDPTDVAAALALYRQFPNASSLARLWVATRWNARDVAGRAALLAALDADDPRRTAIRVELVQIAGDPDDAVARAAVEALR